MATSKSAGSSKLGRDSQAKRLGVKIFAGQQVKTGMIIIRQRGSKFLAGQNVERGSDDTLYALKNGVVSFALKQKQKFDGSRRKVRVVNVKPT